MFMMARYSTTSAYFDRNASVLQHAIVSASDS